MRVAVFRVLAGVAALVAVGFFVTGAWFVLDDLEQRGEMFDGLGAVIGAGLMLVASLAGVMAVLAIRLVRRRPMVSRVLGVLLALTGLGILYPLGVDSSSAWWLLVRSRSACSSCCRTRTTRGATRTSRDGDARTADPAGSR